MHTTPRARATTLQIQGQSGALLPQAASAGPGKGGRGTHATNPDRSGIFRCARVASVSGIAKPTGRTVYKVFARLGLPVKVVALKGKSDGIAYRRYEKKRPNDQWHIDIKHTTLADGTKVYICILIDDHSRYALAAVAGASATTEWVTSIMQQAIQRSGSRPITLHPTSYCLSGARWNPGIGGHGQRPQMGRVSL